MSRTPPSFRLRRLFAAPALLLLAAPVVHAHATADPATWARAWSFEPAVVSGLFLTLALYIAGLRTLRVATKSPRKLQREAACFIGGWLLLVLALVSPIHALGGVLFSVHMVQHELLMVAAAPLLVLGRPGLVWLWALPRPQARQLTAAIHRTEPAWAWLRSPFVAFLGFALLLWGWHVPRWFEASLDSEAVHAAQHLCFLGSAVWFWHTVFFGPRRRASYGLGIVYLFATAVHSGALGALITFATELWYPQYATTAVAWGTPPLQDQQLGGLIMWVPAGLTYIVAALALFVGWMRECERRNSRRPVAAIIPSESPCAPS
jgi:putative membrane protein